MRLKALEMRGFKSFPDRTKMEFGDGITAVVGPNGSGKSNISDAVRWVLGEMSPKSLRGSKMEDVIFCGTAKRPATGYCEVSLIMDNKKRELACDTDEVKITRKYFRTGDSEYKINEKASRLKDIYELFLNTGIGREGYSVVGQGKIAEVLSQKSDERRHIFEEAAGISKFRYRKNDAEKKLGETDANLVRVSDIAGEIGSRLGSLEKEAENAKKYIVLADRKKELEISIWFDRITKAGNESAAYKVKTEEARSAYETVERQLEETEKKLEELYAEKQVLSYNAETAREELSELESEKNRLESLKSLSENDIMHHKATRESLLSQIKDAEEKTLPSLTSMLAETVLKHEEALKLAEETRAEVENFAAKVTEAEVGLSRAESAFEESGERVRSVQNELTNAKIKEAAAENAEKSEAEQREFITAELDKTDAEIADATEKLAECTHRAESLTEEKNDLAASLSDEEQELAKSAARHDELTRKKGELAALLASDTQRKENLERMDRLLEGYPGSVKAIMNSDLHGICGPVSRLLTPTDQSYVTAIETALGAAVSNIVVENEDSAKAGIRHLKEQNAGRATFLPLTSINGRAADKSEFSGLRGFVGIGSELVSYDKKYDSVAKYLLGRTVVADNIDSASGIARRFSFKFKVVTLDGQVINAGGSYTGGSAAFKTGIMSRGADIEKFEERIKKTEKAIAGVNAEIKECLEAKNESSLFIDSIRNDLDNTAAALYKANEDIKLCNERINAAKERRAMIMSRLGEYAGATLAERLAAAAEERKVLEDKLAVLTAESESLKNARYDASDECDAARAALSAAKEELGNAEKNTSLCAERKSTAETRLYDEKSRVAALKNEADEILRRLEDVKKAVEVGSGEIEALTAKIADKKTELSERLAAVNECETAANKLRTAEKDFIRDKEVNFRELTRCETVLENSTKEYDSLTAKLFEEYELTYSEVCMMNPSPPEKEFVTELASVKGKIRALGSVNVNAVEEFREQKERYDFMTSQINDLEASKKSLENVISLLEKDMKNLFSKAVEEINRHFGDVFCELFGGGHAEIVISDPENILESGIEINVQPPGKMVKSISLLSGGEQAFTAIALYFAILKVNPAPFYIFDEIEAALDDVNVARYGAYLRKNSKNTQFIVITHRRGTMEAADTLYGVAMQEKGISNFLKVNIDEVEKKTGLKL